MKPPNKPARHGNDAASSIGTSHGEDALDTDLAPFLEWLSDFEASHGRALRVLHVGNIAANGYLNAKFLRRIGVEADVLCHDYNHVMAMPEWEDVDLRRSHGDDNSPVFHRSDVAGFERPDWFIQGPLPFCVEKMAARRGAAFSLWRMARWRVLEILRLAGRLGWPITEYIVVLAVANPLEFVARSVRYILRRMALDRIGTGLVAELQEFVRKSVRYILRRMAPDRIGTGLVAGLQEFVGKLARYIMRRRAPDCIGTRLVAELLATFRDRFPERPDRLTAEDVVAYAGSWEDYAGMFDAYDIIQCYATEPVFALLSGKRPYVAFEHGTLRAFTMDNDPLHRLTALAYREADHTFITNGDCLAYAERLGIESFSPIVHPVDVEQHRQDHGEAARSIREELGAEVLIFCPVRHDYAIKGTDRAIQALPLIGARTDKRVVMVLIRWGAQVDESRAMAEALGCADNIVWRASMCRISTIKYIQAADVVFDQFVLPVFGSTAPQAIAAGRPVIASYGPSETEWLIPEPAPIVSAHTAEEIADRTMECLDPEWRADYAIRARDWIDRYHSPRNVIVDHLKVYRRVLAEYADDVEGGWPGARPMGSPNA